VNMSVTMFQKSTQNGVGFTYIIKTKWPSLLPHSQPKPCDDCQRGHRCECSSIRRHPSPSLWVDIVRSWP
jgi:hypothetical protein